VSSGLPGFGGQGYVTSETRALSSIAETPGLDTSSGQDDFVRLLQGHDYQIKFLAGQVKDALKAANEASQNPIQQIQQFVADIIVLLGGGELAKGALDFGDLQYILPALGALFGFGDGPFPISLFEAAQKFFLGYVVPQQQFVDVINSIIEAWLGVFGIDEEFVSDVKALITAVGDLFDGVSNLFPSLNELFGALGIGPGDLGPLGQTLGPIINLFTNFDLTKFGDIIEFITDAISPFIEQLTAIINWVNSLLALFGFGGDVVNSPLGSSTQPINNLMNFLGNINFASPTFNPIAAAATFITSILSPTGLIAQLVGGLIQPFNIPGFDASKIVSGQLAQTIITGLTNDIGNALGWLAGFVNAFTGQTYTAADVKAGNLTASDAALAAAAAAEGQLANSIAVAKLQAQQDGDVNSGIYSTDDFERDAPTDINGPAGDGYWATTNTVSGGPAGRYTIAGGHSASYEPGGSGATQISLHRRTKPDDAKTQTLYQKVGVVIGGFTGDGPSFGLTPPRIRIRCRLNPAETEEVFCTIDVSGYAQFGYRNGSTTDTMVGTSKYVGQLSPGTSWYLRPGDAGGLRKFALLRSDGGIVHTWDDNTNLSAAVEGVNNGWGWGGYAFPGGGVPQQRPPDAAIVSIADNTPAAVPGSQFRAFRASTSSVNLGSRGPGSFGVSNNFYDTVEYASSDMVWDAVNQALTVKTKGTYAIQVENYSVSGLNIDVEWGISLFRDTGSGMVEFRRSGSYMPSASNARLLSGAINNVRLNPGDKIKPGIYIGTFIGANNFAGDANGVVADFSVTKVA
jgi:hypothetical protein